MSRKAKQKETNQPKAEVDETAVLDLSCRWPLTVFFGKGAGWLAVGSFLLLFASIKLHGPGFFSDAAWLGLGRVRPAAMNALVYGFAVQAAFGILLWMLVRLGRTVLLNAPLLFAAGVVYNLGVTLGIIGIFAGATTGHHLLEMPRVAWPFIFVAVLVVALWALLTFHARRERPLFVSQWFLVAGLFWFVWILSSSVYLLVFQPVRGVMQAVVDSWYAHNLLHLWLGGVGVAALYYFIPMLTGRPLYSRQIARLHFWTLAFVGALGGTARLSGGPIPNWLASVGIAANVVMIVPLVCLALNLHGTLENRYRQAWQNPILKFMFAAAGSYLLAGSLNALTSLRTVGQLTLFTHVHVAVEHLMILGFFGLAALGCIHYILPRVTGVAWPSAKMMRFHFNASAGGAALYVLALIVAGLIQGSKLSNPDVEFMAAIKSSIPLLGVATLGLMIFVAGQLVLLIQVQKVMWRVMKPVCDVLCAGCCGGQPAAVKAEVKP